MSELSAMRAIGRRLALLTIVLWLLPPLSRADDSLADELSLCSIVQDAELRLSVTTRSAADRCRHSGLHC